MERRSQVHRINRSTPRVANVAAGAMMVVLVGLFVARSAAAVDVRLQNAAKDVGIDPQVGAELPLGTEFFNEEGDVVRLDSVVDGSKPVILVLVYYYCPSLCNQVLNGVSDMLGRMEDIDGSPRIGDDFEIVTISFDSREGPDLAVKKKTNQYNYYASGSDPPAWVDRADAWHWWSSAHRPKEVEHIARSVGFYYQWQENANPPQFSHGSGLFFVSPSGTLSTAVGGVNYSERDVISLLKIASEGTIETSFDEDLFFLCYHFDPESGSWSANANMIMTIAALGTMLLVGMMLAMFWRNERRRAARERRAASSPPSISVDEQSFSYSPDHS